MDIYSSPTDFRRWREVVKRFMNYSCYSVHNIWKSALNEIAFQMLVFWEFEWNRVVLTSQCRPSWGGVYILTNYCAIQLGYYILWRISSAVTKANLARLRFSEWSPLMAIHCIHWLNLTVDGSGRVAVVPCDLEWRRNVCALVQTQAAALLARRWEE